MLSPFSNIYPDAPCMLYLHTWQCQFNSITPAMMVNFDDFPTLRVSNDRTNNIGSLTYVCPVKEIYFLFKGAEKY